MPLHINPPSGNCRHLTSANAGAFIHQSVAAVLPGARIAGEVPPPASSAPFHIAKERTRAFFPAHCSSLASRAASEPIKNLNLFLAGQLRRKARTANNTTGREQSRDLSTSYAPVVSGMARTCLENQNPVHAAPAIHGAIL